MNTIKSDKVNSLNGWDKTRYSINIDKDNYQIIMIACNFKIKAKHDQTLDYYVTW